jgi:hypothetical protein
VASAVVPLGIVLLLIPGILRVVDIRAELSGQAGATDGFFLHPCVIFGLCRAV